MMEILKSALINSMKRVKSKISDSIEEVTFQQCYSAWKTSGKPKSFVSTFFHRNNSLAAKLKEEARILYLQSINEKLPSSEELQELMVPLDKYSKDGVINYKDYKKLCKEGGELGKCLDVKLFVKLSVEEGVRTKDLFDYLVRKTWLRQTRVGLSLYDAGGTGILKEAELERYVTDLIPTLPLAGFDPSFYPFYSLTVTKRIAFFLDPYRTGRVRIRELQASGLLDQILELRQNEDCDNWFSARSVLQLYGTFIGLDRNQNGMLSKEEMASFGSGFLTQAFLDRLFQVCPTYSGEMDYRSFLDFSLAMESLEHPRAQYYLFNILDLDCCGYLTTFALNYFYRSVCQGQEDCPVFQDFKDELFDMIRPKNSTRITLKDIIDSGYGDVFFTMLINKNGFLENENRDGSLDDEFRILA